MKHVLEQGPDPHAKGQFLRERTWLGSGRARWHSAVSSAKMAEPIKMLFQLWARVGSRNYVLDGVLICQCEGAIFRGMNMPGCARRHSAVSCAKWLNWSRYCLGCGLGWAEWSMCYIEGTLAPPGEYDLIIHVWQWCVISSNYFDHLFVLVVFICFLSILSPKRPIECRVESCMLLSHLLFVLIKSSRQSVIKLCIVRTHTHCLYIRPICTGRMCGPYIPVHFLTPICMVHIYRCLKAHLYVWAVYTWRASVPYNSSTFCDSIVEKLRHYWCKVYWTSFCGESKS